MEEKPNTYVACVQMKEDLYSMNVRWDEEPEEKVRKQLEESLVQGVPKGSYTLDVFRNVTLFRVNWKTGTETPSNA